MKKQLGEIANLKYGKMPNKDLIRDSGYPIFTGYKISGFYPIYMYDKSVIIVVARGVGGTGDVKIAPPKSFITNLSIIVDIINDKLINKKYLQLLLGSLNLRNLDSGSAQSQITIAALSKVELDLPKKDIQDEIASKIELIERKIQLNKRINDNLDALLTNIFKKYMINDDFEKSDLTQIANYKNGLAMQKYRPNSNEESLPVLKIKELNQGNTDDSSDRCSANLDNSVIVNTGDIIFSWSGTLLVKNWTGDKAGLNQHLFKVTSNKYPAWFIYEWTKYHLLRFQAIAAGKATTMGHIKRSDLKSSPVYIPSQLFLEKMDSQLAPIYSQRLNLIKENQQLSKLKQTLLNKYF
ncbi:restriction endonuclease subunit S [Limosilactobacillus reuteri]|uniref:restriction endonuclease subunit S n=1 Tax=Limosilactobacillus reuteri TaxID=1598 RepID=UPI001E47EFF4|nr:restriction endonuclease subunit S [Limosilactobacillus reuteri]MCC4351406.1 restriction endonuclease subunit S [Limosilactobacillus reuteri]MCC4378004.1 restriction endonuclease subunit S [Limosilactobacillus reuteri]